ncbi:MAG: hypothetical protein F6K37_12235, partial [Moorea sp. SIO4E2]|uniref:hypothetical protein n=1 Tax=Moorena sp. SIO4E2 TaxID=2607826 RepID=UPI0013BE5A7E
MPVLLIISRGTIGIVSLHICDSSKLARCQFYQDARVRIPIPYSLLPVPYYRELESRLAASPGVSGKCIP